MFIVRSAGWLFKVQYLSESSFHQGLRGLYAVRYRTTKDSRRIVDDDRVEFLCSSLHCSRQETLKMLEKHRALVNMDINRLQRITTMLLRNGIAPEHIRSDLWTFKRNEDVMMDRLKILRSVNLSPIKPWLLRCAQPVFDSAIQRQREANAILGEDGDLCSYLAARLGLSIAETKETMTARLPSLLAVSPSKMKEVLDTLLQDFHFEPKEIQMYPYVFINRVEKLRERHSQLVAIDCAPIHLWCLCANDKQFRQFLTSFRRRKQPN